jgi:predicted TPR repeat methyltransferase
MSAAALTLADALSQAIAHHQAGRLAEAESLYRAILAQQPAQPDAAHNLGVLALQLGQPQQALPLLESARAAAPGQPQFWLSHARALLACGRAPQAAALLEEAARQGHQGPAFDALRAQLAPDPLASALQAMVQAGPTALPTIEPPRSRAQRRSAARKHKGHGGNPSRAEALFRQAMQKHRAGQAQDAARLYRQAVAADPEHAQARHMSGVLAHQTGHHAAALDLIASAIHLQPGTAVFHSNLGLAHCALGHWEAGIASYRRAIELDPRLAEAHYNLGNALRQRGQFAQAAAAYERALASQPGLVDARNNLGIALQQLGRDADAVHCFEQIVAADPSNDSARANLARSLTNLGSTLLAGGQAEAALAHYARATSLEPTLADGFYNEGNALMALRQLPEAIDRFQRAVALAPGHAHAWSNLGLALRDSGRLGEAIEALRTALRHKPDLQATRVNLSGALYMLAMQGDGQRATALANEWIRQSPQDAVAQHTLASIAPSAAAVPERASDAYVQALFDEFAPRFDETLAGVDYQGPALIEGILNRFMPLTGLDILDAGCGTGLAGVPLRARARRLVGVDLSPGMLDKARQRGLHDALHHAELAAFMRQHPASYDLVAAADVLIYFGDLAPTFEAVARALKPGGHLAFTVEAAAPGIAGWQLQPHGRYAHSAQYVEQALQAAGFRDLRREAGVIRREQGREVAGFVVLAGR